MGPQIFNVVTEFRFDIAHAVANSQTLQSEVGKISSAADEAHIALQRVGVGLVAQMGLGSGGFLGAIYTAIKASDKFSQSQRQIANIFLSNKMFDGAFAFEDAMGSASAAMMNMKKAAREFSLPVGDMVSTTKLIGASLISHGLDDSSLSKSTMLSRGFLKSAPTLGVDPGMAQGQLLDAVMGRASMGDTLMQRLFNETDAMKPYAPKGGGIHQAGGGAVAFNTLEASKRVEVLTKALMQFGSNARIVEENARSMSGQLQRLQDNLTGMFSVLKPIGDALMKPIKDILFQINSFLEHDGEKVVKNFSKIIREMFKDPEKLFVNIQQVRRLRGDVSKAGSALMVAGIIHGVTAAMEFLGIQLQGGLLMQGIRYLGAALAWLGGWFVQLGGFALIGRVLMFILQGVLAPLAAWTFFFQIISRAMAKAQVSNAKWLVTNLEKITALFTRLSKAIGDIMDPIILSMEFLSDMVAWIFRLDVSGNVLLYFFQQFVEMIETIGQVVMFVLSVVNGMMSAVIGALFDLANGDFMQIGKNLGKNFTEGFDQMLETRFKRRIDGGDDASTSNKVTNIDKIEINNQFKEQMEPDRIAFILKEQLVKTALNPMQSSGRSLVGSLVGR